MWNWGEVCDRVLKTASVEALQLPEGQEGTWEPTSGYLDVLQLSGWLSGDVKEFNVLRNCELGDQKRTCHSDSIGPLPTEEEQIREAFNAHDCSSCCLPSISSSLCDETRDACFHHLIEALPGLNAIDFVQRVFRKGRDVKILSRASRAGTRRQSATQTRNTIFTMTTPFVTVSSQASESSGGAICRPCGVIIPASRPASRSSGFSETVICGSRNIQSRTGGDWHTR